MNRIKLSIPKEKLLFQKDYEVRVNDINYGNHLGNDTVLSLCHDARVSWLKSIGHSELDIDGVGIIMSGSACQYKNEAFLGDNLTIFLYLAKIESNNMIIAYELKRDKTIIALIQTDIVFFNYNSGKIAQVTDNFIRLVSN